MADETEWLERPRGENDVIVLTWESSDGRFVIAAHPQVPNKYMLTDKGFFAGIHRTLGIAQDEAGKRARK